MRKEGIKIEKMVKKKKKRSKESGDEVLTSKTKSQLAWEDRKFVDGGFLLIWE